MTVSLNDLDRRLLESVQRSVPLVRRPFARIGEELAVDERTVLGRIGELRGPLGVIREISGIFNLPALGYQQALVAMRLPPQRLDAGGRLAAGHPGVSHCYARDGAYNLWFTLAVSPRSQMGLQRTAEAIGRLSAAEKLMVLPTIRRYKLSAPFVQGGTLDQDERRGTDAAGEGVPVTAAPGGLGPEAEQLRAIRALQQDLPAEDEPFESLANSAGLHADALLEHARRFLAARRMRRYAAVLHHRVAGAQANVLVAWRADEALADDAGRRCAQLAAVSHCYLRPVAPDWPFGLYTMIHGRSREDCEMTIREIIATTDLREHVQLWTTAEYKKQRVKLFSDEEATWEQRALPAL